MQDNILKAKEADICLLLEGSYPFVLGGVSAWTHKMIQAFPEYTFAIIFLGSRREDYKLGMRYPLPENVVHFDVYYLFEQERIEPAAVKGNPRCFHQVKELHEQLKSNNYEGMQDIFKNLQFYLEPNKGISHKEFLYSKESWDYIAEQYTKNSTEPSFIDYFWTVRNIHEPLWIFPKIMQQLPKVKLVHTISTGYAGFLGALLHDRFQYPLILSEHGIYTKERHIEILSSTMIKDIGFTQEDTMGISYLRVLWNSFFSALAKMSYANADPIISLFQGAQKIQLEDGASAKKTEIIPNGIDVEHFGKFYRPLEQKAKPIIGFIGRIVPIKDIKTLIRAIGSVRRVMNDAEAWLIGPNEEDPEYVKECHDLIISLGLEDYIKVLPSQDLSEILPHIRVVVLSSISEGMPLVVLESNAAGIPVVATDVGACKELIYGVTDADQALGKSGLIVKIADSNVLADAILQLLSDGKFWKQASEAGRLRVRKYYDQRTMFARYQEIYQKRLT